MTARYPAAARLGEGKARQTGRDRGHAAADDGQHHRGRGADPAAACLITHGEYPQTTARTGAGA